MADFIPEYEKLAGIVDYHALIVTAQGGQYGYVL